MSIFDLDKICMTDLFLSQKKMLCPVDILPVELIEMIFCYLSGVDILRAFLSLSDYIDKIISSYDKYVLNLKDISKNDFNLICKTIRPIKVISLRLFDGKFTPGKINLFLHKFQLEEFIRLRSLHLYSINSIKLMYNIVDKIPKLNQLEILIVGNCKAVFHGRISLRTKSPLSRISVSFDDGLFNGENFFYFSCSRIDLLKYINCQFEYSVDLSRLCLQMPLLHTLRAGLSFFPSVTIVLPKLKRFYLDFNNGKMGGQYIYRYLTKKNCIDELIDVFQFLLLKH
jgi:hypothetical protein